MDFFIDDYRPVLTPPTIKRQWHNRRPPSSTRSIKPRRFANFREMEEHALLEYQRKFALPETTRSQEEFVGDHSREHSREHARGFAHTGPITAGLSISKSVPTLVQVPSGSRIPYVPPLYRKKEIQIYSLIDDPITARTKKQIERHPRKYRVRHTHSILKRNKFIPDVVPKPHSLSAQLIDVCHELPERAKHHRLPHRRSLYMTLVPPLDHLNWPHDKPPTPPPKPPPKPKMKRIIDDSLYRFRSVMALSKANETKAYNAMWDEIELLDIVKKNEVQEIKDHLYDSGWYGTTRLFFVVYCGMKAPYETMNMTDWLMFCKDTKIFEKGKYAFSSTDSQLIFKRVNVEESSDGVEFDADGKKISRGINIVHNEETEDNPDNAFIMSEFCEGLVRIALEKFRKHKGSLCDKVTLLFERHIIKYGPGASGQDSGIDVMKMRERLKEEDALIVFAKHTKGMRKQFDYWCNKNRKNPDENNIDFERMEQMFKFCGLFQPPLTLRQVNSVFILSRDENKLDTSYQLRYASFLELMARCAPIRFNGPQPGMPGKDKLGKGMTPFIECLDQFFELCSKKKVPSGFPLK